MDTPVAVLMCLMAMLLWGSWANTILLSRTRFELFVLDFMLGTFFAALIQVSTAAPTVVDAFSAGWYGAFAVGMCMVSGTLYAIAMLFSVAACNLAGMALSTVLMLGIEISIGTPLLMIVEGLGTVEHVMLSAGGIVAVLMATIFDFLCHTRLAKDRQPETPCGSPHQLVQASSLSFVSFSAVSAQRTISPSARASGVRAGISPQNTNTSVGLPRGSGTFLTHSFHSAGLTSYAAPQFRSERSERRVGGPRRGMLLAAISGMCFSVWPVASSIVQGQSRAGNIMASAKLEPTSFFILYATSSLLACLILLPLFCHRPIHSGEPIMFWPSYLKLPAKMHLFGILGGSMHGLGTVLSLQAGRVLGNSISVSILRCHPLIVSLWGVAVWAELSGAKFGSACMFACMLLMFVIAVALFLGAGIFNE